MQLDKVRKQAAESAGLVASLEEELFSFQRSQGSAVQVASRLVASCQTLTVTRHQALVI